jgi:hypothetical protein
MSRTKKTPPRQRRTSRAIRGLRYWTRSLFGRCSVCGNRVLAYCDHVDEYGDVCSAPICLAHAKASAGKFFCPQHSSL